MVEAKTEILKNNKEIHQIEKKITEEKAEQGRKERDIIKSQKELANARSDISKWSLSELANRARNWSPITGAMLGYGGLGAGRVLNPLSPAARLALQAENELTWAQQASEWGNTDEEKRHVSNYERMVRDNPALKYSERFPFQKMEDGIKEMQARLVETLTKDGIKVSSIVTGQ